MRFLSIIPILALIACTTSPFISDDTGKLPHDSADSFEERTKKISHALKRCTKKECGRQDRVDQECIKECVDTTANEYNLCTPDGPINIKDQFTPIVSSLLTIPNPVIASDGRYHLVYELLLTNASSLPWKINSVDIMDGCSEDVFSNFSGEKIDQKLELLGTKASANTLQPGQSALTFLTFSVESFENIPSNLSHRLKITVPEGIPKGFANFVGLTPGEEEYTELTGFTQVNSSDAIEIAAPLKGKRWIAADGCCTAVRHIRGFLTVNGKIFLAQRFAIDWEKLDEANRLFVGNPKDVTSYFAYGQEALAVADATIVKVVDKFDDQIPGDLPSSITLEEADGNHIVLDLGKSRFAFYAHLKHNSTIVKVGDIVKRGQVLGLVGNTGNTSAPHLHFHIVDGRSTLGSNGLPYVVESYELIQRGASTESFDEAEATGTSIKILPVENPGNHENDLILDLSIVNFE